MLSSAEHEILPSKLMLSTVVSLFSLSEYEIVYQKLAFSYLSGQKILGSADLSTKKVL